MGPALGDVRALRASADGMEVPLVEERGDRKVIGLRRKFDLQPGRFFDRGRLLGK
jgi:hypothetical protein